MEVSKLKPNLDLFKSNNELKTYLKYLDKHNFKKIKTIEDIEEYNKHIDYMNTRDFVDDLLSGKIK